MKSCHKEQERRGLFSAFALFALLLVNNWFYDGLPVSIVPGSGDDWLAWFTTGVVFGQLQILAFWTVLSSDSFRRKSAVFTFVVLPLILVHAISLIVNIWYYTNGSGLYLEQVVSVFSILLMILSGMMIPVVIIRGWLVVHQVAPQPRPQEDRADVRPFLTIRSILFATAFIGMTTVASKSNVVLYFIWDSKSYVKYLVGYLCWGVVFSTVASMLLFAASKLNPTLAIVIGLNTLCLSVPSYFLVAPIVPAKYYAIPFDPTVGSLSVMLFGYAAVILAVILVACHFHYCLKSVESLRNRNVVPSASSTTDV